MESGEGQEIRLLRGDNDPAFAAASSVRFCRICHEEEEEEEEERSAARSGVSIYSHLLVRLPRRKVLILLPVPVCSLGMHTEIIVISVCDEKGSAVCEICLQFMAILLVRHLVTIMTVGEDHYASTFLTVFLAAESQWNSSPIIVLRNAVHFSIPGSRTARQPAILPCEQFFISNRWERLSPRTGKHWSTRRR